MNRSSSVLIIAVVLALAVSQSIPARAAEPAQFQPDPRDVRMLNRIVGNYNAELTANMADGSTASASGTCNLEALPDPQEMQGARGGMTLKMSNGYPFREYDLFGFQAGDHHLHLLSITCEPVAHDHVITVKDDNNFSFIWRGTEDGKPATEEANGRWVSPGELQIDVVEKVDGKQVSTSRLTLKRQDQAMQGK